MTAFNPDQFLAETAPPAQGSFDPDSFLRETEPKSLKGFGTNVWNEGKQTLSDIGELSDRFAEHPLDTTTAMVKGLPSAAVNEGKRIGVGELITGHPINAAEKLGNAMYEKPISTIGDLMAGYGAGKTALGLGKSALGLGAKAAELAPAATEEVVAGAAKAAPEAAAEAGPQVIGNTVAQPKNFQPTIIGRRATDLPEGAPATPPPPSPPSAGTPPPPGGKGASFDPLKEVTDYVTKKYGQAASKPGMAQTAAKYLQEESRKLGGKDLGLQGLQVRQMGEGFKGIEKAEALIDYARDKGYLKPGLTDVARKGLVKQNMQQAGNTVGAIRDIASTRGTPQLEQMYSSLKTELTDKYGLKAPGEVKKVLAQIKNGMKKDPTFSGISDISSDLNKDLKNVRSMGRHVGPTTDAADILSRMNNDAIRGVLNPKEQELYTQSLRDFGAHKKLEKVIAGADRKSLTGRGAPGSITNRFFQDILDRGGYRVAGNVADRTARAVMKNPGQIKTMPQFFEELVHQAEDVVDDTLDVPKLAQGGIVGEDLDSFLATKYSPQKEKR